MQEKNEINTKINFGSQAFKNYFSNTSWLFGQRVVRLIIGFAINIYVIRYLGPDEFGLYSYAISFVGLFAAISALGLDNIIVRELVNKPHKKNVILGSAFNLKLSGAVLSIVLIAVTLLLTSEAKLSSLMILIISTSTLFQSNNIIDFYFQAKIQVKYSAIVQTVSLVLASLLKLVLILTKASLVYFAAAYTLEFLFISAGLAIAYKLKNLSIFAWKFDKKLAINLLKDSWPLILSGLVIAIYMKIDQVIIKNMLSDREVGYYAAAVKLSEAWYFIPMALCSSLFPSIINAKKMSDVLYMSRLQKLYDILTWLAFAIIIPITFFSTLIVGILFGPEYLSSAPVLTIYIWAGLPVSLGVASSQFLVNENLTKISFYRTLAGMIINVLLNFLLIPVYGIIGSALATLIAYSIATFSIGFSKKTYLQLNMMLKSIFLITFFKYVKALWQSH
ncbi:MAG: flippase [Ignavibacteriaceae bacterium]